MVPLVDPSQHLIILGVIALHLVGAAHVLHALFRVRTPSGTIGWIVSLVTFPWVAIPFYWIFGRNKLSGYVDARRSDDELLHSQVNALEPLSSRIASNPPPHF